jgi:hypothetical protein
MPELPLTGGCACGAVRFEISAPLVVASYCHCNRCQRRTGTAASPQAVIERGSLEITSGAELIGSFDPPGGFRKMFCTSCGSALWSRHPEDEGLMSVRLGAFDSDPGIRPSYRQFVAYAASWEELPDDGLPRYPERKPPS